MVVDFQHHYTPPELMETGKGDGTLLLDEAGNSNYRFNLLLADLSAHVQMMDKAGWQTLHLSTRKNCQTTGTTSQTRIIRRQFCGARQVRVIFPGA